jgi:hypothetical protein
MKRFLEFISEDWSVASTKDQMYSPVGKYVFHVTTPERAEKIMKTGLKPTKKTMGKFNVRLPKQPSAFVTGSEGVQYWTNAVANALAGKHGETTDLRDIEILKFPVANIPKNDRRKILKDIVGTRDATGSSKREKAAYKVTKTLGGKKRRDK